MATATFTCEAILALDCIVCGTKFQHIQQGKGRYPRFCSEACKGERRKFYSPPAAVSEINCQHCGRLTEGNAAKRFCGLACSRAARRKAGRISDKKADPRQCLYCETSYQPKRMRGRDGHTYCSRKCAAQHRSDRQRVLQRATYTVARGRCETCKKPYTKANRMQRYCTRDCAPGAYIPIARVTVACLGCGSLVTGTAAKKRCKSCNRKSARARVSPNQRRLRKHKARAEKYGVPYEPINAYRLFKRDGWRCQVCGIKTPQSKRGTYDSNAPEMDHRVPMALGGGHVWSNVQCACRACNLAKGGTVVVGQMNLFPVG